MSRIDELERLHRAYEVAHKASANCRCLQPGCPIEEVRRSLAARMSGAATEALPALLRVVRAAKGPMTLPSGELQRAIADLETP